MALTRLPPARNGAVSRQLVEARVSFICVCERSRAASSATFSCACLFNSACERIFSSRAWSRDCASYSPSHPFTGCRSMSMRSNDPLGGRYALSTPRCTSVEFQTCRNRAGLIRAAKSAVRDGRRTSQCLGIMNGITDGWRRGSIQPAALGQRACEQARTSIAPFDVVAELYRLLEALQHDRMARLETHRSRRDEVRVPAGEEFAVDGHAVAEANHVGVDPPAALFGEKLISEIVRERRWRSLAEALGLIDEDLILRMSSAASQTLAPAGTASFVS